MDVVVVGGGIIGLSSAYYLARAGANVTLCEKGSLGMESTARSAGGIRMQFSTEINVRLSLASQAVWNTFDEEFEVDIAHRKSGYLFLARDEKTAQKFRENVTMQNNLGVESEYLSPLEATDYCPGLQSNRFLAATYNAADGYADPNLAVQGYATKARERDVDIRTKTGVLDIVTDDSGVTGVETDSGKLEADYVVNTAGAWAANLAALAGIDLPISPRRRQIAIVDPTQPLPEDHPLTIDLDTGSYFRPERDGAAIVGGHFSDEDNNVDPSTYSDSMSLEWAATAVEHAANYTAYFDGESRIRRGWAGLYAVTPDHHPIIEETIPGFITAAGFSGHGFQHAPATGKLVAELCIDGKPSLVNIDPLSSHRFENDNELIEQNVA
ncbi:NAD(P)/FAD-dependent oxidoreductase [Haladaptatus caseinilyticus]|uniref:NAD(P)/FAD-dependent oxidoreductase n=1 Tax=Haladaptatus caseinilyticus TaxID=2993314 RepID=UPI00224B956A|nr:FAD-binding oxidoreductase [Haladaptatus caseinilyticus]